jgi:hypothetical protein
MRFYYYKDDNKKEIRKIDRDNICADINDKAKLWSQDVEEVREDYDRVVREIYPSANEYKDQVKMIPDVYEQRQSLRANLFKSTYQNYDGMFDIEGLDPESHQLSAMLKSALVYDCYKIDLQSTLDKILDDYMDKGEAAWFAHWTTKVERKRVQEEVPVLDDMGNLLDVEVINRPYDEIVYEGADIERIDPLNLYFDKSQKNHWESCGKIYREFVPLTYILANKDYKLTRDEIADLKQEVEAKQKETTYDYADAYHNVDTKFIGSSVEVMEYYGDYILPNGDTARNVIIVVIAGKYLAKLDESLYPVCPIGYTCYNERPDSLRGQTPLKPALLLNELENKCMDLTMESWLLTTNPPVLAQKGFINSGITYEPGGVIEYNVDTLDDPGRMPQPLNFSAGLRGFDFQDFFKRKMEGATGISPYMQGTGGTGGVRTASESTYIYSGQTTRLSREAYLFSHNVIVPIIWAIYKLKKEYQTTDDVIPIVRDGIKDFYKVTEQTRNGNYVFMIGNAQTSVERESATMKLFQLMGAPAFQSIVQRPEFPAGDFFIWVLNELNYRQINTLSNSLGIRQAIRQEANNRNIPEGQVGQFVNDMEKGIKGAIPEFANMLEEQQANGQIPDPTEVRDEVRETMVGPDSVGPEGGM